MSPIPAFDHNNVLPPHLGNPTSLNDLSPFVATIEEFCKTFATTRLRKNLLLKLVTFRMKMNTHGISNGFQWIDGSFSQNIEVSEGRPPKDIDVVTFYYGLTALQETDIIANFSEFVSPKLAKVNYDLDHYIVDYGHPDHEVPVELTRYWVLLFSHNRLGVWKGMVKVKLNTPA